MPAMDEFLNGPAGNVIDHYQLTPEMLTFWDEPPGKLVGFSFAIPGDPCKKTMWVGIRYDPATLFSRNLEWPIEVVRRAVVFHFSDHSWRHR